MRVSEREAPFHSLDLTVILAYHSNENDRCFVHGDKEKQDAFA